MIRLTIVDAEVKQCGMRDGRTGEEHWEVISGGKSIAYATSEEEAVRARDAINDLGQLLRKATVTSGT